MSFKDCIRSAQQQGAISIDEAADLEKRFDAIVRQVFSTGQAKQQLTAALAAEQLEKARRVQLAEQRRAALASQFMGHRNARGEHDVAEALVHVLEHFGSDMAGSVEHVRKGILANTMASIEGALYEFRRGAIVGDLRRTLNSETAARQQNLIRELTGEDTGDVRAKELAKAVGDAMEALRQRFNAAGGAIGKLEGWAGPHVHNARAIREAGYQAWRVFIHPLLDTARMKHPLTGAMMTREEVEASLEHVYRSIVTDGWAHREPTGAPQGRGALFRQHADHRFLHFKDAAAWMSYQREFGVGDPWDGIVRHFDTMSRDIAAMEVLGPNPDAMLGHLEQIVQKELSKVQLGEPAALPTRIGVKALLGKDASAANVETYVNRKLNQARTMWGHMRGEYGVPVHEGWAQAMGAVRNLITSASLGGASISALSDAATDVAARRFAGLPLAALQADVIRQFGTGASRDAVASGIIVESMMQTLSEQARYQSAVHGPWVTKYLADRTNALSGLVPLTEARRRGFGIAIQYELAKHMGTDFGQLPDPLRRMLLRHDIGPLDWASIRTATPEQMAPGVHQLKPKNIADRLGEDLAAGGTLSERYMAMINQETEFAVPSGSVRTRALMLGQTRPGTIHGELVRSFAQFKTFGVLVVMLQGERVFREIAAGRVARGAAYAGGLLTLMTLWGGLAVQLKEIARGKDPRRMTPMDKQGAKFWGAAMLQGGGLGIYGDFMFSELNRFGGGLGKTLSGPTTDRVTTLLNLTLGNAMQGLTGEKTNFGRELTRAIGQNTPLIGTLWYTRAAYERVFLDQLQYLLDPEAYRAFRRRAQNQKREYGNQFFWAPGSGAAPQRGPDFGNAVR